MSLDIHLLQLDQGSLESVRSELPITLPLDQPLDTSSPLGIHAIILIKSSYSFLD
jgi:hypothetical protein